MAVESKRSGHQREVAHTELGAAEFGAYRAALRAFVSRRIVNPQEVDDLVQEACARLVDTARNRTLDQPQAYLFRIAANLITDSYRRPLPVVELAPDHDAPVAPTQEDSHRVRDLQHALDDALAELSPRCRLIFIMRRFEDRSTGDIAAELGISTRMVQKYMVVVMTHLYDRLGHLMDHRR